MRICLRRQTHGRLAQQRVRLEQTHEIGRIGLDKTRVAPAPAHYGLQVLPFDPTELAHPLRENRQL